MAKKKQKKWATTIPYETRKQLALDVFNGAIVKQAAHKHNVCLKQAYRIIGEFYDWRLVPKNEGINNG